MVHLRQTTLYSWACVLQKGELHAIPVLQEGHVIHQEAFLLQRLGFELAIPALSEWIEINRLRCALRRGLDPQDAVTDAMSHVANRLAAPHIGTCSFTLASKVSQEGLSAWCVSAFFFCCFLQVSRAVTRGICWVARARLYSASEVGLLPRVDRQT